MRVLVETVEDVIEGEVIDGLLLDGVSGRFDLDATFTVRCDDGDCIRVHGWLVDVEVLTEESLSPWIM